MFASESLMADYLFCECSGMFYACWGTITGMPSFGTMGSFGKFLGFSPPRSFLVLTLPKSKLIFLRI